MERYDYFDAVREDLVRFIEENIMGKRHYNTMPDAFEDIKERAWVSDSVTCYDSDSDSYTLSRYKATKNLNDNQDLLWEICGEGHTTPMEDLMNDPERCDVEIRCNILGGVLWENEEEEEEEEN